MSRCSAACGPTPPSGHDRAGRAGTARPTASKRGHRLPTPKTMAATRRRWDPLPLDLLWPFGHPARLRLHRPLVRRPPRPARPHRRSSETPAARRRDEAFFCTDLTVDHAFVLEGYARRWTIEHTYRFCKQTLNWTTPRVRHPEQADRWTWLVLLAYTQLRLARRAIEDRRLPWERPQRPHRRALTPARVRQAFPQLLVALDTPADPPKPCGRSPGRPLGRRSGPAPRYPAIKKAA